jgi:hypothetical protein
MTDFRTELATRLRDPRAIPILARHAIPIVGVFVLGWSVLETVASLFLDALSTLWLVGATGCWFAAKQYDYGETGIIATLQFWAGVLGSFVVVAGLLTFAVAVPTMFLLPLVQNADVDPWTLLTTGWLPRAFGGMVLCQVPSFVARIRAAEAEKIAPEKMGMDAEVGFVLHRIVVIASFTWLLTIFGSYALYVLVLGAQAFGAVTEIMRDRYVASLMLRASSSRADPAGSRPRKRRRR